MGRQQKEWNGLEWNIILRKAENREEWRKLVVKSTMVPQRSARLRDSRVVILQSIIYLTCRGVGKVQREQVQKGLLCVQIPVLAHKLKKSFQLGFLKAKYQTYTALGCQYLWFYLFC